MRATLFRTMNLVTICHLQNKSIAQRPSPWERRNKTLRENPRGTKKHDSSRYSTTDSLGTYRIQAYSRKSPINLFCGFVLLPTNGKKHAAGYESKHVKDVNIPSP